MSVIGLRRVLAHGVEQAHLRDLQRLSVRFSISAAFSSRRVSAASSSAAARGPSVFARRSRCLDMPMPCDAGALRCEQELGDVPALVLVADTAVHGHAHVVEKHFVDLVAAVDRDDGSNGDPGDFMSINSIVMPACGLAAVGATR